jgi:ribonuclease HI
MNVAKPHYLLFSESCRKSPQGQWRFVLQLIDGTEHFEAADAEPDARGERLELLAVVRGLEALAQPSRVTLVTPSRYVNRGLSYGLAEWRVNGWRWEHYGEMVPVKNRDLWQRVDSALRFHQLDCRTWRFDPPHFAANEMDQAGCRSRAKKLDRRRTSARGRMKRRLVACERWWDDRLSSLKLWGAQCGTRLLPLPWLQ